MTLSTAQYNTPAVNVGAAANDGTGDPLRNAFITVDGIFANIQSVGLQVGNLVATDSVSITGGVYTDNYFFANGAPLRLPSVYANLQVAGYLPVYSGSLGGVLTNPVQTGITRVGTIGNLVVSGNVNTANIIASSGIYGTIQTASQPNITSVGTIGNLAVSGNIVVGNVYAYHLYGSYTGDVVGTLTGNQTGNMTGLVLTNNQPYINSIGTQTYLQVNGRYYDGSGLPGTNGQVLLSTSTATVWSSPTTTINGTAITLGSSGTVTANAGTLTSSTLNATVINSSLQTVGTLTGLAVSGAIVPSANISTNLGSTSNWFNIVYANTYQGTTATFGSATITGTATAGTFSGAGTNLTGTAASLTAGTANNLSGGLAGTIHYQSAAGVTTTLPIGTANQILTVNGSGNAPSWVTPNSGNLLVSGTSNISVASSGNITATVGGQAITTIGASGWTNYYATNIRSTTPSTSATTGALVVAGGVGVTGAVYIAGGIGAINGLGAAGQYLQSTGSGLAWVTGNSAPALSDGTSNVAIPVANGNVSVTVNGSQVGNFSAGGLNVTGGLAVTQASQFNSTLLVSGTLTALNINQNLSIGSAPSFAGTNFTSIPNSALTNSVITINGTTISLGSSVSLALTSLGTVTAGTWNATTISPTYGGTGVNNGSNTLTVNGGSYTLNQSVASGASPTFVGTNFTSVPASILSGSTLSSTVTASSLTTVGILTGLNVAGITTTQAITPSANVTYNIGSTNGWYNTVYAQTFNGRAVQAQYADLAENYSADSAYEPGTVVEFGGEFEVTLGTSDTTRVAGVVSTNPAYLMNSSLASDYVVAVALQGRVPVKVRGEVRKGDMLVSAGNGYAKATTAPQFGAVIGKAIENHYGLEGIIEVVVGRM